MIPEVRVDRAPQSTQTGTGGGPILRVRQAIENIFGYSAAVEEPDVDRLGIPFHRVHPTALGVERRAKGGYGGVYDPTTRVRHVIVITDCGSGCTREVPRVCEIAAWAGRGAVRMVSWLADVLRNLGKERDIPAVVCHDTWFDTLLWTFSIMSISPSTGQLAFVDQNAGQAPETGGLG